MNGRQKLYVVILLLCSVVLFSKPQLSYALDNTDEVAPEVPRMGVRIFEVGIHTDAHIENSYFTINDVLEKSSTPNYNKIFGFLKQGIEAGLDFEFDIFMNLNFHSFQAGLFTKVTMKTTTHFDSNVFKFLENITTTEDMFDINMRIGGSAFLDTGITTGFRMGKLILKISPSYYLPVIYIPYTSASFTAFYDANGNIDAHGKALLKVYSVFPLEEISSLNKFLETTSLSTVLSQGGLDFTLEATYSLFSVLDVGLSLSHIPIVPAIMHSAFAYSAFLDFSLKPLLTRLITDGELDPAGLSYELDATAGTLTLMRPIRLSLFAEWRVFNSDILIVSPTIEFRFDDKASQREFGVGYRLEVESNIGFFNPSFATSYIDEIFAQALGISLNFRVFDLDLLVSMQSQNFSKSFAGAGFGAGIGITIGY